MPAAAPPTLTIRVHGRPAPKGSKRFVGVSKTGRGILIESSKNVEPWQHAVATAARKATGPGIRYPTGPVTIRADFVMPRPKALGTKPTPPCAVRNGDLDKISRSTLDALTGTTWTDDAQVTELHATKRYAEPGEPPGATITTQPA